MMRILWILIFSFISFTGLVFGISTFVHADETSDIQVKIDKNNQQVRDLEAEIVAFQKQLDVLGEKKNTLKSTVDSLTLSQKQLATQIKITQNKIASANLQIKELSLSINDKEATIASNQKAVTKALRGVAEDEQASLIVKLVSSRSFYTAWKETEHVIQFNRKLTQDILTLRSIRTTLATNRDQVAKTKASLISLNNDLLTQKRSVDTSKKTQQQLLSQTKNQEANYQKLIAQKQAAEKDFEQELINLQGQLNLIVHPNLLPKVGTGLLAWPFSNSFMFNCAQRKKIFGNLFCITQYFGNTAFSTVNSQIYNGHGHNAIDFGAPIGTPIKASLSGIILATGNTDLVKGCYSFGKWVMIVHGNGINTLYSHLSEIDVSKGQSVVTGQTLGLSGMTGYATGPHLHFGVYATEGTQILTLKQFRGTKSSCANATMPVASIDAYLNPLSYL